MAWAKLNNTPIEYLSDSINPDSYFHPEDYTKVMNQDKVIAFEVRRAQLVRVDGSIKRCEVLIGVTKIEISRAINRKDQKGDIIALTCPPFEDQHGGEEIILK